MFLLYYSGIIAPAIKNECLFTLWPEDNNSIGMMYPFKKRGKQVLSEVRFDCFSLLQPYFFPLVGDHYMEPEFLKPEPLEHAELANQNRRFSIMDP